jgi:hypothetical protein
MFGSPQAISGEIVRLLCITICRLQKRGINWGDRCRAGTGASGGAGLSSPVLV